MIKAFLFDLDGVFYVDDQLLPERMPPWNGSSIDKSLSFHY